MLVLLPEPAIEPGLITHTPVAGRPFSTTLPVGELHEAGCVMVPTAGAVGAAGAGLITISWVACETHPAALVT